MGKFCTNCGNQINENADFCLNCGKFVNNTPKVIQRSQTNVEIKKTQGTGKSIASMVLGIVSIIFVLLELLALENAQYEIIVYSELSSVIGYLIGYTLLSLPSSIVGITLGISGRNDKQSGFNIAGIILNTIVILCNIFVVFSLLTAWF